MLILADQDGVLADYDTGFAAAWALSHPEAPTPPIAQRSSFYVDDTLPPEWRQTVKDVQQQPWFFRDLPPIPGAVEAMHALLDAGHDVRICTAPLRAYRNCILEKYRWVEEHLGLDWTSRMIPSRDKTVVRGDVLIDDRPDVDGALVPVWTHVKYTQSYNLAVPGPRLTWDGDYLAVLAEVQEQRAQQGLLLVGA